MKIISKFKDYYDSVSHQYIDEEIVYLRHTSKIEVSRGSIQRFATYIVHGSVDGFQTRYLISPKFIGFCGAIFPFLEISHIQNVDNRESARPIASIYDSSELHVFLTENKIELPYQKYRYSKWDKGLFRGDFEGYELFLSSVKDYKSMENLFSLNNTPCFIVEDSNLRNRDFTVTINPHLKLYSFAKVKDPYTAHQELYQFVGGFLKQPDRPMVQISDKDKIAKHGFDKWSFRKMPSKE